MLEIAHNRPPGSCLAEAPGTGPKLLKISFLGAVWLRLLAMGRNSYHFAQELQKMRLPDKLQRILTFPEQTQGDDKPYQFSSVQFSCSIPRGFRCENTSQDSSRLIIMRPKTCAYPRKLRAIRAFPHVSLHHSGQDKHRWRMRNSIV